jgi:hypothetical protein
MSDDKDLIKDQTEETGVPMEDISEVQLEQTVESRSTAHDDFDWNIGKRNTVKYEKAQHDKYLDQYDQSLNSVAELEIVKGRVTGVM